MEISPVKDTLRIALVGDYNAGITAHQAIPLAIDDAAAVLELLADYDWLSSTEITSAEDLVGYDAIWVVPGSPYKNTEGALTAIRYARENSIPFLEPAAVFNMPSLSMRVMYWAGQMPPMRKLTRRAGWL